MHIHSQRSDVRHEAPSTAQTSPAVGPSLSGHLEVHAPPFASTLSKVIIWPARAEGTGRTSFPVARWTENFLQLLGRANHILHAFKVGTSLSWAPVGTENILEAQGGIR